MTGRIRATNPQARREYVDAVTGARTRAAVPGSRRSGRLVTRVRPRADASFEVVPVDPEDLDPARDTFGIDASVTSSLRERARSQAKQRSGKPMSRDADLDLGRAGATTTFTSGRAAADAFMRGNPAVFDNPLFESTDLYDATKDFMDRLEVRSGKGYARLVDTPRGREILEGGGRGHVSIAREMMTYLMGQAGRSRRWRDVPWTAVDGYVDAIVRAMQEEAKRQGRPAPAVRVEWYPLSSGVYPPEEVVALAIDELGEAKAQRLAAWLNSQSLYELADRLQHVLEPLKGAKGKAARRARRCLSRQDKSAVRRRIREIRDWAAYPDSVPNWACVATRETETTGVPVCMFPALEQEIDRLLAACDVPYDADWPVVEHAKICAAGETDTSGLPPQPCPGDDVEDVEPEPLDDEPLDLPWENPAKEERIARRQTSDGKTIYLWSDGSLTWALGEYVRGSARPRTEEQKRESLTAGWMVLGEVELYDAEEVPALVKAARWAAVHGKTPGEMRARLHDRGVVKPVWTIIETDRDGKPRVRTWVLPRIGWPGLAVWHEKGKYSVWTRISPRDDAYAPTGMEFTNLRDLTKYLDEVRVKNPSRPFGEVIAEMQAAKDAFVADARRAFERDGYVEVPAHSVAGKTAVLTRSARPTAKYQITDFDRGDPTGHIESNTLDDALTDLWRISSSDVKRKYGMPSSLKNPARSSVVSRRLGRL